MTILQLLIGTRSLKLRILQLLLLNPNLSFGIRDIGRRCKGDPGNTKRFIDKLEEAGLIICVRGEFVNSARLCKINRDFYGYEELKKLCLDRSFKIMKKENSK